MIYTVKAFRAKKVVSNIFALLHTIFCKQLRSRDSTKLLMTLSEFPS